MTMKKTVHSENKHASGSDASMEHVAERILDLERRLRAQRGHDAWLVEAQSQAGRSPSPSGAGGDTAKAIGPQC